MISRSSRLFLIVAAVLLVSSFAAAEEREQWFVIEIAGSTVGFASEVEEGISGGWVLRSHMDMSLSRMGTPLSMFMLYEETCDLENAFLNSRMEMSASITGIDASAELDGDTLLYRFETGGSVDERRIAWEQDAVSQRRANELLKEWLPGNRSEIRLKTFRVDEGKFIETRVERQSVKKEVVDGREQMVTITEEYEGNSDTPISTTYYDEDLKAVRTVMRQMGLEIIVSRITVEEMATIEVDPNFDIIRQSMIPCTGYPDPPSRVQEVTVRLTMPRLPKEMLCGPNQEELGTRGDDTLDLRISRDVIGSDCRSTFDHEATRSPTRYIQSGHPDIVAVADRFRDADTGDTWATAQEISRWVNGHITAKNFSQGFASALEVFETRAGDCTEHSMLLVAVLRAAGITSRPAVGLAYSQGQFVGHMWAEVWLDDGIGWHSLDALDLDMTPIRIRITASDGEVDQRALMQAYSIVGGMTAEVIDYKLME